jgi:hypothetical protein
LSAPYDLAVGDLNGDGRPDLAVTQHGNESVRVLLNLGGRSFGEARDYDTDVVSYNGARAYNKVVEIVDVDGDGLNDLIIGGASTRIIYAVGNPPQLTCP